MSRPSRAGHALHFCVKETRGFIASVTIEIGLKERLVSMFYAHASKVIAAWPPTELTMSTVDSGQAQSGRRMVLVAAAVTIVGDLIVTSVTMPRTLPAATIATSVIRFSIEGSLFYAIWRGQTWARWLMVACMSAGLLLAIPEVLKTMHPLIIGVGLQCASALYLLAFRPSVGIFLGLQRSRYAKSADAIQMPD